VVLVGFSVAFSEIHASAYKGESNRFDALSSFPP